MSVAYVRAGTSPTAAQLRALASETDAIMRCVFADKTPLIYYPRALFYQWGRMVAFGTAASWKIIPILQSLISGVPTAAYNHATFTATAAGLTISSIEATLELAYVVQDPWPLDGSLEAHKIAISGIDHYYCQKLASGLTGYRERYRRMEVLDVLLESLGGSLTWDSKWDKYHFIRFHNLDPSQNVVTLPGGDTVTLPAFGIRSVRRTYPAANTWDQTYRYLWNPIKGDSLIWSYGSTYQNNVASMLYYHAALDSLGFNGISFPLEPSTIWFKPSVVWDGSSLLPQAISGATKLIKYRHHVGRIISWTSASGTPVPHDFSPTWDDLEAGTNGIKLDIAALTISADSGASTPVDAVGIGSTLLPVWPTTLPYDLNFGAGSGFLCYGVHSPGSLSFDAHYHTADPPTDANKVTVTSTQTYYEFTGISTGSFDLTADLDTNGTMASDDPGGELLPIPAVTWSSDGCRLVGSGTQSIPASYGLVPSSDFLPYCDVTVDGFVQHFGDNAFNDRVIQYTSRRRGRKLSPYVGDTDLFDNVTYLGHPDMPGELGLAEGIDWNESRAANTDSAFYRDDSTYHEVTTYTGNVSALSDPIDTIDANATDAAWYSTNRTRLLAQQTVVGERQQLVRLPILAQHYNQIAQRINGVMHLRPLTIDDVIYYGGANPTLTEFGLKDGTPARVTWPADYYCEVLAAGSRADSLGITVQFFGGYYIKASDVAAYAASLGLRFFKREFSGLRKNISGTIYRTRNTADSYRVQRGHSVWIGRCVEDGDGHYQPPPVVLSFEYEELVEIEHTQANGPTLPTGWQLAGDDMVMVAPRKMVNWSVDPHTQPVATQYLEPMDVYGPVTGNPMLIPAGDLDGQIVDQADIVALMGSTGDTRAPLELTLVNRWFIRRA